MRIFNPARVFFEPRALDYPMGRRLHAFFVEKGVDIFETTSHNQVRGIPGEDRKAQFYEAKRTLVVGVRRGKDFQTAKPSADYMLPLVTGCPGHCHYCYLNTSLGNKPYVRVYVNLEEIMERAAAHMAKRPDGVTVFDGSCTSDPVVVEPYTHALQHTIEYFADRDDGRFRFVTKYDGIDGLLDVEHNEHTEVRFSINSPYVVKNFEKAVASMQRRLEAAAKIARAGYPTGFLIGPIMVYDGWEEEYEGLLQDVAEHMQDTHPPALTFELITHRFTPKAKALITDVYPDSPLPMDESERKWKWGQFGYGKYIYPKDVYKDVREVFEPNIEEYLPEARILYTV